MTTWNGNAFRVTAPPWVESITRRCKDTKLCAPQKSDHVVDTFVLDQSWRHQMETVSTLLAFCTGNSPVTAQRPVTQSFDDDNILRVTGLWAGNSPVTGEFSSQRPVTRSFDVFFDLRLNKRLRKQSRCQWWFETSSRSLWRHCNELISVKKQSVWPKLTLYLLAIENMLAHRNFCSIHYSITLSGKSQRIVKEVLGPDSI